MQLVILLLCYNVSNVKNLLLEKEKVILQQILLDLI